MDEPLKFVSNVIELKPGHKYLLVVKGDVSLMALGHAQQGLREKGIDCLCFSLGTNELDVIEIPTDRTLPPPIVPCPDCLKWDLSQHDREHTEHYPWWCQCPDKWEIHLRGSEEQE